MKSPKRNRLQEALDKFRGSKHRQVRVLGSTQTFRPGQAEKIFKELIKNGRGVISGTSPIQLKSSKEKRIRPKNLKKAPTQSKELKEKIKAAEAYLKIAKAKLSIEQKRMGRPSALWAALTDHAEAMKNVAKLKTNKQ